jgi:hypothetical protein
VSHSRLEHGEKKREHQQRARKGIPYPKQTRTVAWGRIHR